MRKHSPRGTTSALLVTALAVCVPVLSASARTPEPVRNMAPCAHEDGSASQLPCYWDAATRGNKTGHSFWMDTHRKVHYLADRGHGR